MARMPAAADPSLTDAVAALVAVTACEADPSRGDAAVEELAEAVRAAAPATVVAVWTHDPREAEGRMVAALGVAEDDLAGLAAVLAGAPEEAGERELGTPGDDP